MAVKRSGLGRGLDALIRDPNADKKSDNDITEKEVKAEKGKKKTVKTIEKSVKTTKRSKTAEAEKKDSSPSKTASQIVNEQKKLTEMKKTTYKDEEKEPEGKSAENTVRKIEKPAAGAAGKNSKKPAGKTLDKIQQKTTETAAKMIISETDGGKGEMKVRLSLVEPNREQPRKAFSDDSVSELADSIRQHGVITPLIVQKKDDHYEIIAGERRWRAAKEAGLKEIPVLVRDYSSQEAAEIAIIENIQREDLNPMEEAAAYRKLMDDFNLNQEEVASKVSKSRAAVANSMRLLKLDKAVQEMVRNGSLSEGHARAILGVEDSENQRLIAEKIVTEHLNVRQTEQLVKDFGKQRKTTKKTADPQWEAVVAGLSEKLKTVLGTKVAINQKTKKKGVIEIEYYSGDDLERIYELLLSLGGE